MWAVMARNCDEATALLDLLRPSESMSGLAKILHDDSNLDRQYLYNEEAFASDHIDKKI